MTYDDDMKTPTPATSCDSHESDMESKTPTKDQPNPEPIVLPKIKAELKPLQEELRKIDSLSILSSALRSTLTHCGHFYFSSFFGPDFIFRSCVRCMKR